MNCKYILLCFFLLFKVSIAQKNIEFKNNLIKSYIQKGNYSKALQYNQSFLEQSKTNIDTLNYNINKAILLVFHGDMIEANKLISKMNSLEYPDIEKYRYYELMIQYSYSEGQMYLAKDFLKKSVDISKNIDEPNIKMKGVLNDIFLRSIDRNSKNKDSIAHHEQWLVEQFNIIEPMFKDVFPENQSIYLKYRLKLHPENKNISKKDKLAKMEVIHGISQKHDLKVGIFQYLEFRFNEEKNHQKKKEYLAKLEIAANQIDWLYHKSKFHFIRSNYYFDLKDYDKSKESAKIILYQRGNYFIEFKESFEKLTKIYIAENKTDSILIVQNIMSKNIENSILDLSNTVFEVISANTKLEIEKSKSESDKNTSIVLMFLISLLFFSIVVSLFYFKSRKYNKQIKDINKELTYKNTFMQEYVSLVSHDLRSPVSSIISLSKLHQEEESIEEMKNAMWLIEQQGNRSIATISSLVAHYKMKTKQSSNFMRINLYSLLEGIQSAMRTILLKNNIKLDVDIDVEIFINGNREFLHRLFQNLIENSIKFRKIDNPDSNIIIRAEEIDNTIKITIWDNGIGIQPQKLKNIKTNWDNHLSIKSDGFGLPFVKEIMDYHKGEISINSEYGEFTQIDLHFFN